MRKSEKFFIVGIFMMIIPFLGFVLWSYWINVAFTPDELDKWDMKGKQVLVITPMLTANYNETCNISCEISRNVETDESQKAAIQRFVALRSGMITDLDLTNNTNVITYHKTIILLDNVYVTQEIHDAIKKHSNVIYLYPNALSGIVQVQDGKMSVLSGVGMEYEDCTSWDMKDSKMTCRPTKEMWKNDKSIFDFITSKS